MKKTFAFFISALIFLPTSSFAEDLNQVKISCFTELNFIEISTIFIPQDLISSNIGRDQNKINELKNKYDMQDQKTCTIAGKKLVIKVEYLPVKEKGMCASDPGAIVSIFYNNDLIIKIDNFMRTCTSDYGPQYIMIRNGELTICPSQNGRCEIKNFMEKFNVNKL